MRRARRYGVVPAAGAARVAGVVVAALALAAWAPPPAAAQGGAPDGFLAEIDGQFEASAQKIIALARAMPASSYSWTPAEGVYTVARVYTHIATYNYMYPHQNMGRNPPVSQATYNGFEAGITEKDEVVRTLEASVEFVRSVLDGMSEADLDRGTTLYGRQVGQYAVLLQLVTHMNEHLGQAIAYARMNGVVPPWSR